MISGIGRSEVGRRLGRSALALTLEACLEAVADAGLETSDIDGLSTYPGSLSGFIPAFDPGTNAVQDALRLKLNWYSGGNEGPGQISAVINACMAVATGLVRHVLVYRTVLGFGGALPFLSGQNEAQGSLQWHAPYGVVGAPHLIAPLVRRHMHEFGTTRSQLGLIAVNARRNARLNPGAVYRESLSLEDYLQSRMISDPICLFDCDVPVDGSTAFVVSAKEFAPNARNGAVRFEAVGTAIRCRPVFDQADIRAMASRDAADHMWGRTTLRPSDVDVAQLYDGFTFLMLAWLEDLGFCGRGEAGEYIEGGRIALDGDLPVNTDGGQLCAGRLHGFGLLHEACVQLRGIGGDRQVENAEVAVVSNGASMFVGCMLLTRWR